MPEDFVCNNKKSFRSNVQKAVPALAESFLSQVSRAVLHPNRAKELHEMRLSGKLLRYLMELCGPYFGKDFKKCYKEIKDFVALAGEIHDLDLALESLALFKREMELFNKTINEKNCQIPASSIAPVTGGFRKQRAQLQQELCAAAKRWQLSRFNEEINASLYRA